MSPGPLFETVPAWLADEGAHRRLLAAAVNRATAGRLNVAVPLRLAADADETVLRDPRIGAQSVLLVMPLGAGAAAGIFVKERRRGLATFGHAVVAGDRDVVVAILG